MALRERLVALVLEAMDLDPVLLQALEAAQVREGLVELLALLDDDCGLWTATAVGASIRYRMKVSAASSMKSMTSSIALISAWISSRSNGVTNVDSTLAISWLRSSPRCSASRISWARCSGAS